MKSIQKYAEEENKKQERKIGIDSKVVLQMTNGAVELKIQMSKADIETGIYDVTFSCIDPGNSMIFAEAIVVGEEGQGEFDTKIELEDGLYDGCQVLFGTRFITFDRFTVRKDNKAHDANQGNHNIRQVVVA
jgi:hypothetical protein